MEKRIEMYCPHSRKMLPIKKEVVSEMNGYKIEQRGKLFAITKGVSCLNRRFHTQKSAERFIAQAK